VRIVVVAKDGSGNYNSIQTAVNNAKPGDTIQVKNGVYNEGISFRTSGTRTLPIALVNYPGHSPVIDPGGGRHTSDSSLRVEIKAEWIIVEGFEIRYGWNGIKVYQGHNTIRGNWIHHSTYQGILIVSTDNVFVDGNTIEYSGTDPNTCIRETGESSPKQCHGIYLSDSECSGISDVTIRGNVISNHGGRGIQWNAEGCSSVIENTLVENNIFENNSWGMVMYYNVERSVVRNNTFVLEKYPSTNDTTHTFIGIYGSTDNIFKNNIFHSTRNDVTAVMIKDNASAQNTFDYNLWKVSANLWEWKDSTRTDFSSQYRSITGWDKGGLCCNVDPGFYNLSTGIYHLKDSSPAIDRGEDGECSSVDHDGELRLEAGNRCDIGMDEYSKN